VARIPGWPPGKDTAAVGRCIAYGNSFLMAVIEERGSAAVQQRVPVVGDCRIEESGIYVAGHLVDRASSDTQVADDARVTQIEERLQGAIGGGDFLEGTFFGVVEIDE